MKYIKIYIHVCLCNLSKLHIIMQKIIAFDTYYNLFNTITRIMINFKNDE